VGYPGTDDTRSFALPHRPRPSLPTGSLCSLLEGLLGRSAMRERKEASQATESPEPHGGLLGRAGRRASHQRTRMWALMRPYTSDAATDVAASWAVLKVTVLDVPLHTGHSEFVLAAYTLMSVAPYQAP